MNRAIEDLKDAIELGHHCRAEHVRSVPVVESSGGNDGWNGVVEVFELVGHPKAQCCYAWFSVVGGFRQCMTVLQTSFISSPQAAVRAAIRNRSPM